MNPFIQFLTICEAVIALSGLVFAIVCIACKLHVIGPLIGFGTFGIFTLFVLGMWMKHVKHID